MPTIYFHLKPKIELNKIIIYMLDIRVQVKEGQKRWSKGLNIQFKDINKEKISEFIQYKIMEYRFYNIINIDL